MQNPKREGYFSRYVVKHLICSIVEFNGRGMSSIYYADILHCRRVQGGVGENTYIQFDNNDLL